VASRTVRGRLDRRSEADLELLLREGGTESDVVRVALAEPTVGADGRHFEPRWPASL